MAILCIIELRQMPVDMNGKVLPIMDMGSVVTTQVVNITGTSAQSSAFNDATRFIRLSNDVICQINWGTNPTATAGQAGRLGAEHTEFFGVPAGQSYKVAVRTDT